MEIMGEEEANATLSEYVMVMVNNGKSPEEMGKDLTELIGSDKAKALEVWFVEQNTADNHIDEKVETQAKEEPEASSTANSSEKVTTGEEKPKSRKISLKSKSTEKLETQNKAKSRGSGAKGSRILLTAVKESVESTAQNSRGKRISGGLGKDQSLADLISSNNAKNEQSHGKNNHKNKKRPSTGHNNNRQSQEGRQHSQTDRTGFTVTFGGSRGKKAQKLNHNEKDYKYDDGDGHADEGDWEDSSGKGAKGGKGMWFGTDAYGSWDQGMYPPYMGYPMGGRGGGWGYGMYPGYGMPAPWMMKGKGGGKGKGRGRGKGKGKAKKGWNVFVRKEEDTAEISESLPKTPPDSEVQS